MELMKGVHRIPVYANCALLVDDRIILIDTSKDAAAKAILDYLPKTRLQPRDITNIIVTHCHPDHAGGLHTVKAQAPAARVAAHEADAETIGGKAYPYRPINGPVPFKGVRVDDRLQDGQRYEGLRVIHTPGHTPGSIALLDEERSLLLAGDSFNTDPGSGPIVTNGVGPMSDDYNSDPAEHRASVKKLAAFDFEVAILGHGEAVTKGASTKVKELARRL
ncbi:MAG TPA: MBL fold metallo-hydrolase [Candidatus Thermoplasmatota archaeon]|jgi:glyoxylase-like metal-dependent hydrolase (beta-lactamase superfamily II)|nr:MBL fold metallo-hydrolase [Candidatus Thermoplasmatota archaeon]